MRNKLLYGSLAVAVLFYMVSVFVFKTDSVALARYQVSDWELKLLSLAFTIPTFVTWFAAVYSIDKITAYAARIKETKDGKGIHLLAWGLVVLGFGVIAGSLISRVLSQAVRLNIIDQAASTIISSKISIIYLFACFLLLFLGSLSLLKSIKKAVLPLSQYVGATFAMVAISVPYVAAVLLNPSRTVATGGSSRFATYAMPDWLILTTVVLPYLITWVLGIYAVLFLRMYQKQVGGLLYKRALSKLYTGFAIIVILTIVLQFISAISPIILGWVLTPILLLLSLLLIVIVVGYLYIAFGAKGLTKLEEVT